MGKTIPNSNTDETSVDCIHFVWKFSESFWAVMKI